MIPDNKVIPIAGVLLASVSILDVLPTVQQKVEFADRAMKTIMGFNNSGFCVKGYMPTSPIDPACTGCRMKTESGIDKSFDCPLLGSANHRSIPIHTADSFFGYFLVSGDSIEQFTSLEPLLFNFLTILTISIDNLLKSHDLRKLNLMLQSINAEKDKFFSILAHDLRSPFTSFLGYTQMMAEELPSMTLEQVQKIAVSMSKSATNLYRLLENLLEWSRLQRGAINFSPESFLLMPKISECMESVLESAGKKEIQITFDIPKDLEIFADMHMIQTVIRNLASNAVKYTAKGGKVEISAKTSNEKTLEMTVKDNGIGITKNMIDHLFRLDQNINRTGTEGEPSTGLGLIICKDFVEKHGGKIWVESEEGDLTAGKAGGSAFYFTLPQATDNL